MSHRTVRRRVAPPLVLATLAALVACGREEPVPAAHHRTLAANPSSLALVAGSSAAVRVTPGGFAPERARVTWESDAPDVAAVAPVDANGYAATVSGRRVGTAVLRATTRVAHASIVTAIPVTVTTAPCLLIGPSIGPQTSTLAPGETVRIRILPVACGTAAGDTAATWVSLDTLVAVVDSTGLVTARAPGVAMIRAALLRAPNRVAVATVTVRAAP